LIKSKNVIISVLILLGILGVTALIYFLFYKSATGYEVCKFEEISTGCSSTEDCKNYIRGLGAPESFFNEIELKCSNNKCLAKLLNGKCGVSYEIE